MNEQTVREHLNRLYSEGDTFELVAVKDGQARRKAFTWPSETQAIMLACETFEGLGWNVYSSVMPLEIQATGNYDRIWIDVDDASAPWPWSAELERPIWPEPLVAVFTSHTPTTGFRWQAVWKLTNPIPEKEARRVIKQLADEGKGDGSVHDPRRVLRLAGIRNAKRDSPTRIIKAGGAPVSIEQFMLPQHYDESGNVTLDGLMSMNVSSPHEVLGEFLGGVREGDRARKAYVTARFLRSCKVSYDDALPILVTGGRRAEPPLSDNEIVHALDSAYHRVN